MIFLCLAAFYCRRTLFIYLFEGDQFIGLANWMACRIFQTLFWKMKFIVCHRRDVYQVYAWSWCILVRFMETTDKTSKLSLGQSLSSLLFSYTTTVIVLAIKILWSWDFSQSVNILICCCHQLLVPLFIASQIWWQMKMDKTLKSIKLNLKNTSAFIILCAEWWMLSMHAVSQQTFSHRCCAISLQWRPFYTLLLCIYT